MHLFVQKQSRVCKPQHTVLYVPDAERASSNITAEQLSAAQLAVQRATRGLTGPEAARVLDADGTGLSCCCKLSCCIAVSIAQSTSVFSLYSRQLT